jgi:N-acetylglucosaminyl-diphospho-decaprenol L-rhamnosyltransferase
VNHVSAEPAPAVDVSVIIVNYNTAELTLAAVESALAQGGKHEVIVVDNGSQPASVAALEASLSDDYRLRFVPSGTNLGFGQGNNLGATHAQGEFLFLLNSDAHFVEPDVLTTLSTALRKTAYPGIMAPRVLTSDGKTEQHDATGAFPNATRTLTGASKRRRSTDRPDWVSGCALMINRELFEFVGGFDTRFFMYLEDVHLCWKVQRAGRPVIREQSRSVIHLGGKSYTDRKAASADYEAAHAQFLAAINTPPMGQKLVHAARAIRRVAGSQTAKAQTAKLT